MKATIKVFVEYMATVFEVLKSINSLLQQRETVYNASLLYPMEVASRKIQTRRTSQNIIFLRTLYQLRRQQHDEMKAAATCGRRSSV